MDTNRRWIQDFNFKISSFPEYIIVASCVMLSGGYLDAQW